MIVAVMGHGTVGSCLVEQLDKREDIQVKYILEIPEKCVEERMVSDIQLILDDPEVELVADALPSIHPSYEFIKLLLQKKKHVVTSNKAALCYGFEELTGLATEHGVMLLYEASCGGTVPCIREAFELAKTNEVTACYGIMNGTTNYILYNMLKRKAELSEMLKEAQELGYAEKDPSADLSGFDVKNKLAILSATAYRGYVNVEFPTLGVERISLEVLQKLSDQGKMVKLMGLSVRKESSYALAVAPVILPMGSLEAEVPENYNLFTLLCSNAGPVKLYGQGAGGQPTADAMVRDILFAGEHGKPQEPYFVSALTYDPSLLTGTALFEGKEVRGRLDELISRAKDLKTFLAFEPDFLR